MKSVVGVVQARTGSTRLPGKVLRPLADRSVLGWVIRAARASAALDDLIVATTNETGDDAVVAECAALGVTVHRGPTDDVLTRFLGAIDAGGVAKAHDVGAVVRFTADCPLLDPAVIEAAVSAWRAAPWLDYVSTALPRSVPRGMDVEVVRADTLRAVGAIAGDHHRTHVTSAIYTAPDRYRMLGLTFQPSAADLRVTLDTAEDWALIETVVDALGDRPASMATLVPWLRAHPDVVAINAHVEQKPLAAG
jgi:spore coat polysaccharide biosynthesis protein SpsF